MAIQVAKVNLSPRALARAEVESNVQRSQKPHDIRGAIPMVDWTNPAKFPPYVFREYPKMPLLDNNQPIVIDESGGVLIFYDAADEVEFKDNNPDFADEIERNTPAKALADAIAAKDSEIEDLRARLRAAGIEEAPKKPKNALAAATRPAVAAKAEAAGDPAPAQEAGLRENLPKTGQGGGNPLKKKH